MQNEIDNKKKINLLIIMDFIFSITGGTENQVVKIINNLDNSKFQKTFIALKNTPWLEENKNDLDCKVFSLDYNINNHLDPKNLNEIRSLIKLIKKINPDIAITFFPTSYMFGVISAKLAGVKKILSTRRDYGLWLNAKNKIPMKIANLCLDGIITNSKLVKDLVVDLEKIDAHKIDVIYNGMTINEDPIDPEVVTEIKQKFNIPNGKKIIGLVAGLRPMKNHQTLIEAAKIIKKSHNDIIYLLIGDGARKEELISLVDQHDVSDIFYFMGWQTDIKHVLSLFDIGVNCSGNEGLSNAIMEYMAYGVPCIVSDSGGNPELIENNVNGLVFKTKDAEELAQKILFLLDNEKLKNQFSEKSKEIIKNEFSINTMIKKYENYFNQLNEN